MKDDAVFIPAVRDDDSNVGDVECGGRDVEDGGYGERRADADEVETAAEGDDEPNGVDGCASVSVYFGPEAE